MATTLNNLALIYQAQGRHKEAQPLHRRALAIAEKSLGPDHPNIVKFLSNLAALYEKMGKAEGSHWVLGPGGGDGEEAGREEVGETQHIRAGRRGYGTIRLSGKSGNESIYRHMGNAGTIGIADIFPLTPIALRKVLDFLPSFPRSAPRAHPFPGVFMPSRNAIRANRARMKREFEAQSRIGRHGKTGLARIAFTREYNLVRDLVRRWMEKAGLKTRVDAVGNLFGRKEGEDKSLPAVMSGSHLDSQNPGGRFDGVAGVFTAPGGGAANLRGRRAA